MVLPHQKPQNSYARRWNVVQTIKLYVSRIHLVQTIEHAKSMHIFFTNAHAQQTIELSYNQWMFQFSSGLICCKGNVYSYFLQPIRIGIQSQAWHRWGPKATNLKYTVISEFIKALEKGPIGLAKRWFCSTSRFFDKLALIFDVKVCCRDFRI